jgi:hypothetical protein
MRWNWRTPIGLLLAACSSDAGPSGPQGSGPDGAPDDGGSPAPATAVIVSAAIPRSLLPAAMAGSGSLVFVSAAPGSFPGAMTAHILGSGGDSAIAQARDGGFDPLPVAGTNGGLLTLSIIDSAGRRSTSSAKAGPAVPRVVRLSPASRRTDVPLNVRIVAVFSAPVDSATAVAGVQLLHDGVVVPTESRLSPDRLAVVLEPDAPLEANTTYEVAVAATVTDVFGTALGAPVSTSFTTGTSIAGAPFLSISGYEHPWRNSWRSLYRLQEGDAVGLALLQYENGPQSAYADGVPTIWSSSDPSVLQVVEQAPGYAIEVGLRPGRARLRAEALGTVVERDVEVVRRLHDFPAPDPATLLVQVNVSGTDPDTEFTLGSPDYWGGCDNDEWYGLCPAAYGTLASGLNTLRLGPGDFSLVLWGVATHCVATDGLTRDVSLVSRQTVSVTFTVDCASAASTLRVRPTVTGAFLPSYFRLAYSNSNCLACEDTLPAGQWHDVLVGPGPQRVSLIAAEYCVVQDPNPVQATVSAGAVLEVGFDVLCTYFGQVNVGVSVQGADVDESFWLEGSVVGSAYDGYALGLEGRSLSPASARSFRLPAGQSYRFRLSDIAPNCRVVGDNPATVVVQSEVTTPMNFSVTCE